MVTVVKKNILIVTVYFMAIWCILKCIMNHVSVILFLLYILYIWLNSMLLVENNNSCIKIKVHIG